MNESELLEVVAEVIRRADHPEITGVSRFEGNQQGSPAGVKVLFENGSANYLLVLPSGGWKAGRS